MRKFEIESVEGVGYLLFERFAEKRTRRIGQVFLNIQQAKSYLGDKTEGHQFDLIHDCPYEEMIGISH